tara:strand:- start:13 stop:288 length:276 start_codon:yes stop_codon:yes gene_type:complete
MADVAAHLEELRKQVEEAKIKAADSLTKKEKITNQVEKLLISSDTAIKQKQLLLAEKEKEITTLKAHGIMLNNYRLKALRSTLRRRQRIGK